MNIIFLGSPGAGKGTVSKQLADKFNYYILSPGELYRKEAKQQTEFGLRAKEYWDKGNICPDEMTNELIYNTLKSMPTNNVIFDGYPRRVTQAQYLDGLCIVPLIIDLGISDDVSIKRLLSRREKENRLDDTEEIIKQRLKVYHDNNDAIVKYYKEDSDRYRWIDATRSQKEVFDKVCSLIDKRDK